MAFGFFQRRQRKGWQAAATETAQGVGVWMAKARADLAAELKGTIKANQRDVAGRKLIEQVAPVMTPASAP